MRAQAQAALLCCVVAACAQTPTDAKTEALIGILIPAGRDSAQINAVADGARLKVSIKTYGDECDSKGETRVTIHGSNVEITPMDSRTTRSGRGCADILREFDHFVDVAIDAQRPWIVKVNGRIAATGLPVSVTRVIH